MNKLSAMLPVAVFSALTPVSTVAAKSHDKADQVAARAALARGEVLPVARILSIATAKVPGDVVEVELKRKPFGFQYDVKVLTASGRVREIEVNARNGTVLSVEDD